MPFNTQKALDAGYSEDEVADFLSKEKKFNTKKARSSGYSSREIIDFLNPSEKKEETSTSPLRLSAQLAKGAYDFTTPGLISHGISLVGRGESLAELEELKERLPELKKKFPHLNIPESIDEEKYKQAIEEATGILPTGENLLKGIGSLTGEDLSAQTPLEKAAAFIGSSANLKSGGGLTKVGGGLTAEATKEALEQAGIPEPIAEALALSTAVHEKTPAVNKKETLAAKEINPTETITPIEKRVPVTFESGLTKPRAVESDLSRFATLSAHRKKSVLQGLDKEASVIAKQSVEKHLPLAKSLEKGFNFHEKFENNFTKLRSAAKKFNPEIDTIPIGEFLSKSREAYKGIPHPHQEALKIKRENEAWLKRPQARLYPLLKTFRSNNRKLTSIYETSLLTGKQREYAKFLRDYNKSIIDSFKKTLPEDSLWLNQFLKNNENYHKYLNTKETLIKLDPLLRGKAGTARLERWGNDPYFQKKLSISMGPEGAKEIAQLSKDLLRAREAIKNISPSTLHKMDGIYPIGLLIPYVKIPVGLVKGVQASREMLGWYLSKPETRVAYDQALKSIEKGDVMMYKQATSQLLPQNSP